MALLAAGYPRVAGLDEAGRGAWAGPVCAAAVVLPLDRPDLLDRLAGVHDSKELSPHRREELLPTIYAVATGIGVGWASPTEVDTLGVVEATRRAMMQALDALNGGIDAVLVDYVRLPDLKLPQRVLPKADRRCLSVAAASIVAKVERDRWMIALDQECAGYGFARHKGYPTRAHREAVERMGLSPVHRRTWRVGTEQVSGSPMHSFRDRVCNRTSP